MSDAVEGCLLGLACGDALGRPVEFLTSAQIATEYGRVTEMRSNGAHGQPAGTVTDDTEMALCIARSLAANDGFDGDDVAARYVEWYESGPLDVGGTTRAALERVREDTDWETAGQEVWEQLPEGDNAGNGSLMRCAPYALAYRGERLAEVVAADSRITHADPRCVESCVALATVIAALVDGADPSAALAAARRRASERDAPGAVRTALSASDDPALASLDASGFVLDTLETALHDGLTARSAEDAIVTAVNRGEDTDTTGAVAGAVAGARFGAGALPDRWLDELRVEGELRELAATIECGGA